MPSPRQFYRRRLRWIRGTAVATAGGATARPHHVLPQRVGLRQQAFHQGFPHTQLWDPRTTTWNHPIPGHLARRRMHLMCCLWQIIHPGMALPLARQFPRWLWSYGLQATVATRLPKRILPDPSPGCCCLSPPWVRGWRVKIHRIGLAIPLWAAVGQTVLKPSLKLVSRLALARLLPQSKPNKNLPLLRSWRWKVGWLRISMAERPQFARLVP
jgi:hypothetical protein